MTNFIITGTSGVGKTHLEMVLKEKYGFFQLVKYTDRPQRQGENSGFGIGFLDRETLDEHDNEYFFTLYYAGFRYSWRKEDLENNKNNNITIAITLEATKRLLQEREDFIPIILNVEEKNFNLLIDRNKKKLDYDNLSPESKLLADRDIHERLDLARSEIKTIHEFEPLIEKNHGKIFSIKNDQTLYDEVIPFILSKI